MNKEIQQMISDLKGLCVGHKSAISHARNVLTNEPYFKRTRKWLEEGILKQQQELEELLHVREHGLDSIDHHQSCILVVNKKIQYLEHKAKIDKLMKLFDDINNAKEVEE